MFVLTNFLPCKASAVYVRPIVWINRSTGGCCLLYCTHPRPTGMLCGVCCNSIRACFDRGREHERPQPYPTTPRNTTHTHRTSIALTSDTTLRQLGPSATPAARNPRTGDSPTRLHKGMMRAFAMRITRTSLFAPCGSGKVGGAGGGETRIVGACGVFGVWSYVTLGCWRCGWVRLRCSAVCGS